MIGLVIPYGKHQEAHTKKREDGEGLLVDYALKKGRYVGTQASAQSVQVSSPTTKQSNSKGLNLNLNLKPYT
jgi:hypothetical protein